MSYWLSHPNAALWGVHLFCMHAFVNLVIFLRHVPLVGRGWNASVFDILLRKFLLSSCIIKEKVMAYWQNDPKSEWRLLPFQSSGSLPCLALIDWSLSAPQPPVPAPHPGSVFILGKVHWGSCFPILFPHSASLSISLNRQRHLFLTKDPRQGSPRPGLEPGAFIEHKHRKHLLYQK